MKTASSIAFSTLLATALVGCSMFKSPTHNGDFKVEPADQARFDQDYKECGNKAELAGAVGESSLYDAEIRLGYINRCLADKGWKR